MTALTGLRPGRQRGLSMTANGRIFAGGAMTHRQRLSMIAVMVLAALGLSFAGAGVASAAPSAPAAAPVAALATPVTGTAGDGTFAGTFTPAKFTKQNGNLMATGLLTGTVKDASGATVGTVDQTVSMPVAIAAAT